MSANPLMVIGPPWILLADLNSNHFASNVDEVRTSGGQLIKIDGANAKTPTALFDEFAKAAKFPSYFGRNWPAFDECLADLEWLPGTSYVVTLENPDMLLQLSPRDRSIFVKVITKVALEWAQPVSDGEYWDRPRIPFHLVAHDRNDGGIYGALVGLARRGGLAWLGPDVAKI